MFAFDFNWKDKNAETDLKYEGTDRKKKRKIINKLKI